MITSINVRYTNRTDLDAPRARAEGVPPQNILIQAFCGVLDQDVVRRLVDELREAFPGTALVGTSTAGEIMDATPLEGSILLNFSFFERTTARSALAPQNDDLVRAGADIGQALADEDAKAVMVLGCGLKAGRAINSDPLLAAISRKLPDAAIAGGQAGDNGKGETTFVFTEDGLTEHGVAAAALSGADLMVNTTYNLSWVPIGKKLTITAANGPRVLSIDDQPPYEIYKHYLGQEVADGLPLSATDFPLITVRDGIPMAVHAMGVNDDGSFEYIHDFYPGEQLRFGFCHAGLLALGAQVTHAEVCSFAPQAVFIYSCVSRKWSLGADIAVELSPFADLAPSAGFFCYGEYFRHASGKTYFFSQTMTLLCLSEGGGEAACETRDAQDAPSYEESRRFRTLRVLHRLVETSTREIEQINHDLANLANKDSLTGLANRRLFDERLAQEIKYQGRTGMPLSLLLMDIDFFKRFNDTYGHVAGDNCLRAAAGVFRKAAKRPSDTLARYGGEEFACILPATDFEGAMRLAEDIRQGVQHLHIPHAASDVALHVTISLGVLTVADSAGTGPEALVDACDRLLYEAKQQGRNTVRGDDLPTV